MKKFVCTVCDYIFEGDELPEDYECPPVRRRPRSV